MATGCYWVYKKHFMETTLIVVVVLIAIAFVLFLIRQNLKDEKDTNPELTNKLEKEKEQHRDIK